MGMFVNKPIKIGFRLATLTGGVKRPVYSDVAEERKRFEVISEIQATLIRLFMLC